VKMVFQIVSSIFGFMPNHEKASYDALHYTLLVHPCKPCLGKYSLKISIIIQDATYAQPKVPKNAVCSDLSPGFFVPNVSDFLSKQFISLPFSNRLSFFMSCVFVNHIMLQFSFICLGYLIQRDLYDVNSD